MLRFTQISKKAADEQQNKSAITDHAIRENHIIDWNWVKVVGHETDRRTRWMNKAIAIHKHKERAMDRDTGSYFLASTYDKLLHDSAQFHQNDTSWRWVDTFLRKTPVDIEMSMWIIKVRNSTSFIVMLSIQPISLFKNKRHPDPISHFADQHTTDRWARQH